MKSLHNLSDESLCYEGWRPDWNSHNDSFEQNKVPCDKKEEMEEDLVMLKEETD